MQLLISLSALLLSVMLVQMGIGALRPFDSISGAALGFTSVDIGLIASGHFAGFYVAACLVQSWFIVPDIRVLLPFLLLLA